MVKLARRKYRVTAECMGKRERRTIEVHSKGTHVLFQRNA